MTNLSLQATNLVVSTAPPNEPGVQLAETNNHVGATQKVTALLQSTRSQEGVTVAQKIEATVLPPSVDTARVNKIFWTRVKGAAVLSLSALLAALTLFAVVACIASASPLLIVLCIPLLCTLVLPSIGIWVSGEMCFLTKQFIDYDIPASGGFGQSFKYHLNI